MHAVGIDVGAKTIEVAVLRGGELVARAGERAGADARGVVRSLFEVALEKAGIDRSDLRAVAATGVGCDASREADLEVSEAEAVARAASHLFPGVKVVIDVGAEESRAVRLGGAGEVIDVAINERCAAGTGAFVESMARALAVDLEEIGRLSTRSTRSISMNAQCVVFAESEMVGLIHEGVPGADIARAVHEAIAERIGSMVRKVGFVRPIALVGGMARNIGFREALQRNLGVAGLRVPEEPELCAALGAALLAMDET